MKKKGKMDALGVVGIAAIALVVLFYMGVIKLPSGSTTPTPTAPSAASGIQCAVNPTYTYSSRDQMNGVNIQGGTDYIRSNGNAAVTSLSAPPAGKPLQFWHSNTSVPSYFCEVQSVAAVDCGAQIVQTNCYKNATVAIKVYDLSSGLTALSSTSTTGTGATNVSIGANGLANLEVTFQGTAKQSLMPFGGCVAVEVPNSITSVSLTGLGITPGCPYTWTYSSAATTNTQKFFTVPKGFDKDGLGDIKKMGLQIQNGGTDITAGNIIITFQPANYYLANDGTFDALDIEKSKNQATTKTADGSTYAVAIS